MYGRKVPSGLKCQFRLSVGGRWSTLPTRESPPGNGFRSMPCVNGQVLFLRVDFGEAYAKEPVALLGVRRDRRCKRSRHSKRKQVT